MKQNKKDQPINTNPGDLKNTDLQDPERDQERLKPDEATIDLPDVKDIPGQEFIHPPNLGEFADTTISSDDEEGVGIFEDSQDDNDIQMNTESDISKEDKLLLQQTDERMPTADEDRLRRSSLDDTDNEGDPLNERSMENARTGSDLDTSGVDEDNRNEFIGEEDEENNTYSLGGENEADDNNGTIGIP
jgi:hypothetical protein